MTTDAALERVRAHQELGTQKYPPFRDRAEVLRVLDDYVHKAQGEHNSGPDADKDTRFAKRILQVAGIATRACVDLGITDNPDNVE